MKTVTVHASVQYDVLIERGSLASCGKLCAGVFDPTKAAAAIIADDNVASLYLNQVVQSLTQAGFAVCTFVFPHGEDSKSHEVLLHIYDFLIQNNITRSDFLVALGGGVTGDLVGFAAATYLRGVRFVQIPTTFLAAIDSSVGGKTAVNIPAGKNLIGAFHQPSLVVCDPDTFSTLTPEIFDVLARTKPGKKGEVQLTDALRGYAEMYGYVSRSTRYDIGDIPGWIVSNLQLLLKDERYRGLIVNTIFTNFSKYS